MLAVQALQNFLVLPLGCAHLRLILLALSPSELSPVAWVFGLHALVEVEAAGY